MRKVQEAAHQVVDMLENVHAVKGERSAQYCEVIVLITSLAKLLVSGMRAELRESAAEAVGHTLPDVLAKIGIMAGLTDEQIEEAAVVSARMIDTAYGHMQVDRKH